MGIFRSGYEPHSYREWLLGTVSNIISDSLNIGSAGLLRSGAVAWVSVEVPENIKTPEGIEFRPNLLATTSFDGSVATTFKRCVTTVVCDNTRDIAMSESGQTYKVRHTKYSGYRIDAARDALAMVETAADDYAAEIAELCRIDVSDKQWAKFLDAYVPIPADASVSGRSVTMATNKHDALNRLYRYDERCAPHAGTAYGVVQTVDTYAQHVQTVRGAERAERNMVNVITGVTSKTDNEAYATLRRVLAAA
jgi:phage/plasmid-like protein (TIGR03299 family)